MPKDVLSGKKIILGITGCIAAYKSLFLIRELKKLGAEVRVVATPSALNFVTTLSLSTLSGNKVITETFSDASDTWHIDYSLWADLFLIAPATINTISKIAYGFADNSLTTLVSAARSPILICPAADVDMYLNPIVQENIIKLKSIGYNFVDAEEGLLASGLKGFGRLADIKKIVSKVELVLNGYLNDLADKKILVTAGPTYEDIDPVRFIGNRSSGKMGFEIAKSAWLRGAKVTLITGHSAQTIFPEIKVVPVRSAEEMKKAVDKELKGHNILIMSAAVADFKPIKPSLKKIKKENNIGSIKVSKTIDILSSISASGKIIVGFALETENELKNAEKKLREKNLNMIVLNSIEKKKSGFEVDTNKITIIHKNGKKVKLPLLSKFLAGNKILDEIKKNDDEYSKAN